MTMLHISALAELHQAAVAVVEKTKHDGALSAISREIFELQRTIEKVEGKGDGNARHKQG